MSDLDHSAVYRGVRLRVGELVRSAPADHLDRIAPATPQWRVRDVVSHLVGATADMISGNTEGLPGDAWTQAQVDARYSTPMGEMLDEWERCCETVEPMIAGFDPMLRLMMLTDAVTHEHDIRGALGRPGARDSDAVAFGFESVSRGIGAQRGEAGALRIVHDAGEAVVGAGEPTATLRVTRFEVLRAAVGRRSYDQIAAWGWDGEALPEKCVLGMFTPPRETPLEE